MGNYEVVIPCADKDKNKVKFALASAAKYLIPPPKAFHVICQSRIDLPFVWIHNEAKVLDLDPTQSKFRRPRWVYQQFLKLFNDVSSTDLYMVVDSDLIFNKEIHVFNDDGIPYFYLGIDHNHGPDFAFLEHLFGFGRTYPHSFTVEFMLINKKIRDALAAYFGGVEQFYNKACSIINYDGKPYRMNDYETYGNFTNVNFPGSYGFKKIKSKLFHIYNRDWTEPEIVSLMQRMENSEYDVFTYHTWV